MLDAPPEELCKVKGMGKHGAVLLKTVKELSGRYLTARTRVDDIARNSRDSVSYTHLAPGGFIRRDTPAG